MRQEFRKPAWMKDLNIFLFFSFVCFTVAFGIRCIDLPKWGNPAFMVGGEYIMGTHDAYFWLAGAKGVGSAINNGMAQTLRFLGELTGIKYGNLAFWLPAVFSGLTAVVAYGWGALLGGRWAGLVAGVYTTCVPSYFFRTRLSYYDTDLVTLMFPLLITLLLGRWLKLTVKKRWLSKENFYAEAVTFWDFVLPCIAGWVTMNAGIWHSNITAFGLISAFVAVFIALVCSKRGAHKLALQGVLLFSIAAFLGIYGFILSLVLAYFFCSTLVKKIGKLDTIYTYLVLFVGVILISGVGENLIHVIVTKIATYTKPVADVADNTSGPLYPGIAQSVIEAQNINISEFFSNIAGSELIGWAGFFAFFVCLLLSPTSLLLTPFIIASLAALTMGGRFAMFGGVPIGIGFGFVLQWAVNRFITESSSKKIIIAVSSVLLSVVLPLNNFDLLKRMPVTPVIYKQHAEALIQAGKVMPPDSTVWTWWDWGYATMYYAGQNSFANGGNHAGHVLYPLAVTYATPSILQANQLIKYSAFNENNPSTIWSQMSSDEVLKLLTSFSKEQKNFPIKEKQYFVVTWKDISLAHWILYYGAWNVKTGESVHPNFGRIYERFNLDLENGVMQKADDSTTRLSSYNVMEDDKVVIKQFPHNTGPNMLFNRPLNEGFLMGDFTYASMLVKMMIINPQSSAVAPYFKLVYEGSPFVRIYEVL